MNVDEILSQLSEEQMEKARACKSSEELVALARSEGIELSDEQLQEVAGGREWYEECDLGKSGF